MNCQEGMDLMQRYLDRDVSNAETEKLMQHLKQCPDCEEMFDRLQQLSFELENLPKVSPPFSIVDSILPDLERMDAMPSDSVLTVGTVVPMPARTHRSGGGAKSKWYERISYKAWGGTAAAAVIFALIWANLGSDEIRQNADSADEILLHHETEEAADSATDEDTALRMELTSSDTDAEQAKRSDSASNAADPDTPVSSEDIKTKATDVIDQYGNKMKPKAEPGSDGDGGAVQGFDGSVDGAGNGSEPQEEPASSQTDSGENKGSSVGSNTVGSQGNDSKEQGLDNTDTVGEDVAVIEVPSTRGQENGEYSITAEPDTEKSTDNVVTPAPTITAAMVNSPDGSAYAVVMNGQVVIKSNNGDALFVSEKRKEGEQIGSLKWSSDSKKLSYEVAGESGTVTFTVDIKSGVQSQNQ